MPDIRITYEEVKSKANEIRSWNTALDKTLQDIKSAINGLEADWTSDASDTIRAKISGMQPKFDSYKEVIESYAKFLDSAVQQYENTENSLNSNANQFI